MMAMFDIFMRLPDGQPVWIKAVHTLEEAELQLAQLAAKSPGDYFIFNVHNGQVTVPMTSCRMS
jgi:hypothetical protein